VDYPAQFVRPESGFKVGVFLDWWLCLRTGTTAHMPSRQEASLCLGRIACCRGMQHAKAPSDLWVNRRQ